MPIHKVYQTTEGKKIAIRGPWGAGYSIPVQYIHNEIAGELKLKLQAYIVNSGTENIFLEVFQVGKYVMFVMRDKLQDRPNNNNVLCQLSKAF